MSLYEELTKFTYVDGRPDGMNYCFPCNRYISYSRKFSKENNVSIDEPALYEYFYTLFNVFKQEYPNTDMNVSSKTTSVKAEERFYKFAEQFVEDNGDIFSCFSNNEKKEHFIKQYINTYFSKLKSEISTHEGCKDYYGRYDSSLSACNLCPFTKGNYQINNNEYDEELLLRLFTLNKNYFESLRQLFLEQSDKLFSCVIDLHSGLKPLKEPLRPFVISIYREYALALTSVEIDWDTVTAFQIAPVLSDKIFENISSEVRDNYSSVTKNLLDNIISYLSIQLFGETNNLEFSSEELSRLDSYIENRTGIKDSLVHIASTTCSNDLTEVSEPINTAESVEDEPEDKYIPPQDFIMPSEPDIPFDDESDENKEKTTVTKEEPSIQEDIDADCDDISVAGTLGKVLDNSEDPVLLPAVMGDIELSVPRGAENAFDDASDSALHMDESLLNNEPIDTEYTETPIIEQKLRYGSVVHGLSDTDFIIDNTFDEVERYAEHLTNSTAWMFFENTVLSDRFMAVEALHTSDKRDFLLFWGRGKKCFFFLYMTDSDVMEMIKPYLTRNQYIKISYQPYHIYAFGRKYGIEIKRVFSIQTCYSFLNNGTPLLTYEDTINYFCTKKMNEKMDDNYPMLLAGMKMYPFICSQCNRLLKESGTLAKMDSFVDYDEAISRSYYIDDLYENARGIPAFQLVGANAYVFPQVERGKVLTPGKYFNFQIGEGYESYEAKRVIIGVITYLAEKGRFRKCNIYLCNITDMTVKFFIPDYYVRYFETLFSRIFADIAKEKVGKKLKLLLHEDTADAVQPPKEPTFDDFFADEFMNNKET